MTMTLRFGWVPDIPDPRDYRMGRGLMAPTGTVSSAAEIDATSMPTIWDQGNVGSCVAQACGAAHEYARRLSRHRARKPSRLFLYYEARRATNPAWVSADTGASIRGGMKALARTGVCAEALWPYTTSKVTTRPPAAAYRSADDYQAVLYARVDQTELAVKSCIVDGFPVLFGFSVFESFMSDNVARSGIVPLPAPGESLVGGHAVLIAGYDDKRRAFRVRNSWGARWGIGGHCWMPYEYVLSRELSADFWTLRTVEA